YNSYKNIDKYQITASIYMGIGDLWENAYKVINQSNAIIKEVSNLNDIDQGIKDQILGESYFIRALAYFDLNRSYGGVEGVYGSMGVPIALEPTNSKGNITYPERASIEETYKQVESDLKKAKDLLPEQDVPIRASKAAAEALLSRLY